MQDGQGRPGKVWVRRIVEVAAVGTLALAVTFGPRASASGKARQTGHTAVMHPALGRFTGIRSHENAMRTVNGAVIDRHLAVKRHAKLLRWERHLAHVRALRRAKVKRWDHHLAHVRALRRAARVQRHRAEIKRRAATQTINGYKVVGHLTVEATAYWPDPSWSNGYTATGMRAQYGIVAVDPNVIPLGTHLYIPGYGQAIAEDTGGAIIGDHIDLCYDTAWQAQSWGVQYVTIDIEN